MTDLAERLWQLLAPHLDAEGVELDDLELSGRGAGRLVRVTVDAPHLDVDRIADLSRGLRRLLEEDSVLGDHTLEVSSPGLERKLRRPGHFHKSVGREVDLSTDTEVEGATHHRGTLTAADDSAITVLVDGETRRIPITAVAKARTVFIWEPAAQPGKRKKVKR